MALTEKSFKAEIARAKSFLPIDSQYYSGYIKGLRRQYHGSSFGTDEEHKRYLRAPGAVGRGYRAGYEFTVKPGRKKIGNKYISRIQVPDDLKEKITLARGPIPEAQWVRELIEEYFARKDI